MEITLQVPGNKTCRVQVKKFNNQEKENLIHLMVLNIYFFLKELFVYLESIKTIAYILNGISAEKKVLFLKSAQLTIFC